MLFDRIRGRDMGPLKGDFDIDLTQFHSGELIALKGENGAGKTTFLGLLPGALYRDVPKRGTLAELANARDSFVEVVVQNGVRHTVRQLIDGVSKKGETSITDEDGVPALNTAKVSEGDLWIKDHFPPAELLYCSAFAVQGKSGIFDLSTAERKEVVNRAIGTERFERMASFASKQHAVARAEILTLQARLSDLAEADVAVAERMADAERRDLFTAEGRTQGARAAIERAKGVAGDAARRAELATQRRAVAQRLEAAKAALAGIDERIANNRALLGRGEEIREAVARAAELEPLIAEARVHVRAAEAHHTDARVARDAAAQIEKQSQAEAQAVFGRVRQAEARLRDRAQVADAVASIETARELAAATAAGLATIDAELARLETLILEGKDRRIAGLREGLVKIGEAVRDAEDAESLYMVGGWAANVLAADDDLANQARRAPEDQRFARAEKTRLAARLDQERAAVTALERLAARAPEMADAAACLAIAQEEAAKASIDVEKAEVALAGARAGFTRAGEATIGTGTILRGLETELAALQPKLAKRANLDQAETLIAERTAQRVPAQELVTVTEAELDALPAVEGDQDVDLLAYERALTLAEHTEKASRERLATLVETCRRAKETTEKRSALDAEIKAGQSIAADWLRLAQDIGREGIQAMEIDAAVPELNAITNALLHEAFGPRWTVEFKTTRLSADGSRSIEDLEIRVLDTKQGRDGTAEMCSGGELVIVGTAVSLALTSKACQRFGGERVTLVRDESGAALSPENARAWITMLKVAAKQINAAHCLIVTHSPEIADLCDARIEIENGKVRVAA